MTDTVIVIVTYNSASEIGSCLEATLRSGASILVVDNASTDHTCEVVSRFPVNLIRNERNLGFAGAVNQAIRQSTQDIIVLLNPDAALKTDVEAFVQSFGEARIGACGGLLVDVDGSPQSGFTLRRLPSLTTLIFEVMGINRILPENPVNWHYRCKGINLLCSQEAEQPAGALLAVRREAWIDLEGFDETFWPAWFEDVDFCKRLRDRGWRIRYEPAVIAVHSGGHSVGSLKDSLKADYWYGNLFRYTRKHWGVSSCRVVSFAILLGSVPRAVVGIFRERRIRPILVYLGLAGQCARSVFTGRWG